MKKHTVSFIVLIAILLAVACIAYFSPVKIIEFLGGQATGPTVMAKDKEVVSSKTIPHKDANPYTIFINYSLPSKENYDYAIDHIGNRYILWHGTPAKDGGGYYGVFDSLTQKTTKIEPEQDPVYSDSYQALFITSKIMVFVTRNNLCAYNFDSSSCVQIPGAKLPTSEVYGFYEMGGLGSVVETHSDKEFTIQTYKSEPIPTSETELTKLMLRKLTFKISK